MKNKNAIAAWLASHAVIAAEQLAQRYAHYSLPHYWEQEAIADATTLTLYVGKEGLKSAVKRAWGTVRSIWTGPATAAAPASK